MIRTLLIYALIDKCLDIFFDDLDVKLTPLNDIYTDAMLRKDLSWAVSKSELKFIDLYEGSLTITLISRLILVKRKMNVGYEQTLSERIYHYLDDMFSRGEHSFNNVMLIKMHRRLMVPQSVIMATPRWTAPMPIPSNMPSATPVPMPTYEMVMTINSVNPAKNK